MENLNWKTELKKMFTKENLKKDLKGMGERLLIGFYFLLAIIFVRAFQTETQYQSIMALIQEKDWTMIMIIFFGFVIMTNIIDGLFKAIFWIIKLIVVGCSAKKNGA